MYNQISSNKRRTAVLLVGFLLLLTALGWVISKALGQVDYLFIIGVFSLSYAAFSYFGGAKLALAVNGAREIKKKDNPLLWRTVENLSIAEGLPMPKVYIMEDPALNAFATGRSPDHAAVCATSGLLEVMDKEELEGVMAHELGHVKNLDVRVNTLAFALVGVISLIADFFLRFTFWGSDDRDNNNQLFVALAIVAAILAPIAASLLQLALSRRREYLADATGALTTRYPEGLASALEKIGKAGGATKKQNTSTAHMFFVNPLKGHSLLNLFSTHPPIEARIKALREMQL